MPILPSTLEYSTISFQKKIDYISKHQQEFKSLAKQEILEFHIDLVYPSFAKDRAVMSSISLTDNYKVIESLKSQCKVTIHFMGLIDDVILLNAELEKLKLNKNIKAEIYLPITIEPIMVKTEWSKYHWFDLDQYDKIPRYETPKILLMTVIAGKSGQSLTQENKTKALNIVTKRGTANVIVDGGWSIDDSKDGIRMVSYSSFWKAFGVI